MAMSAAPAPKNRIRIFKIVVLGDGGVGKSALTMQFVYRQFLDYHDPTIEDSYQQHCRIDGEPAHLDILDTAGQPEFTAMREQYMRTGEGFVICYSVTDRRSFEEAMTYKRLVDRVRNHEDVPIVLVGNKCDLQLERKVSSEEGQALASRWDCPFYETSAALRHFVDDAFHCIIREIRHRELEEASATPGASGVTLSCIRKDRKRIQGGSSNGSVTGRDLGKIFKKIFH